MKRYTTTLYLNIDANSVPLSDIYKKYFEMATDFKFIWIDKFIKFHYNEGVFKPLAENIGHEQSTFDEHIVKCYTWEELIKGLNWRQVSNCLNPQADLNPVREQRTTVVLFFDCDISGDDLFDTEEKISIIDYSATITNLEERCHVETKSSENWLTTDGRSFKLTDTLNHVSRTSSNAVDEWWEVDILGTPYGEEITIKILSYF